MTDQYDEWQSPAGITIRQHKINKRIDINDILIAKVFALMLECGSQRQTGEQLDLAPSVIKRVLSHPKYKELETTESDSIIDAARKKVRIRTAKQADLVIAAMESNLKDGNMDAVKTWLKTHGLLTEDAAPQGDQSVQIILPNQVQENSIDANFSTLSSEEEHS